MKVLNLQLNRWARVLYLFIGLALIMQFTAGCSTRHETYRETTTTSTSQDQSTINDSVNTTEADADRTETTVREESTTTTEDEEPRGIISGTWHFIGQVLAFPFKVVAWTLEAIF